MNWELWIAGLLLMAGWFWLDSLKKRELAVATAKQKCAQAGVQLLDETVSLAQLRFRRDGNQQLRFYRKYAFEFSDNGDNRLTGNVILLGDRVQGVDLILPAGPEKDVTATVLRFPDVGS